MTLQQALSSYEQFAKTNAPTNGEVELYSRGQYYPLDFDVQLVNGKIQVVAKINRQADTEAQPAKAAGKAKK